MIAYATATQKKRLGSMPGRRNLVTLCSGKHLLIGFVLLAWCIAGEPAVAAPFIPEHDDQVLEQLPVTGKPQTREVRRLREKLSQNPDHLETALKVARHYAALGRAESDPRYFGYVQAALRPWWHTTNPPPEILLLRAIVRQADHQFQEALDDLSRVLQVRPHSPQAWLTRAVIQEVRGDYTGALRSCMLLIRLHNALMATSCLSSATSLSGQAEEGYHGLRRVLENSPSVQAEEQLWAFTVLAEIAVRLGYDDEAEQHFQEAFALGLRDTYLLRAYTDFLLDQNRPAEVQDLLQDDIRPDGLLLRLTLAEQHLNAPQLNRHVEILRTRFMENRLRGDTRHLRTEARFTLHLLHDSTKALELARQNWAIQREPGDARILLEAAIEAQDPASAQPVLDWLHLTKLEDVRLTRLTRAFK